ncbi:MAG TPA: hypothetical protein VNX46_05920 [Candidatus Acidoferrum sp.]|jgi:hypothetical protein|nr:hypothetical protein [Candidatus Acidoferrum sp.]
MCAENYSAWREDQAAWFPQAPKTLEELETQLLQSTDRLDQGEGVEVEQVFRRLRKRIKESRGTPARRSR